MIDTQNKIQDEKSSTAKPTAPVVAKVASSTGVIAPKEAPVVKTEAK